MTSMWNWPEAVFARDDISEKTNVFLQNQRNPWNSKNKDVEITRIHIFWISLISPILQKSIGFFTYIVPGENGFRPISHRCHLNCSIWTKSPCEIGRKVFPNWQFAFSLFFVVYLHCFCHLGQTRQKWAWWWYPDFRRRRARATKGTWIAHL